MTRNAKRPASKAAQRAARLADYRRRLRAAGFPHDDDDDPAALDIDTLRIRMARMIAMFINEWHGCREPLCRRQRGCMAPHGRCSNAGPPPRQHEGRALARVSAALKAAAQAKRAEMAARERG